MKEPTDWKENWKARAEAAEARYKRLVDRLKKEIAETADWTDDGDDGDFFQAVRVSKIEAAINESEAEG